MAPQNICNETCQVYSAYVINKNQKCELGPVNKKEGNTGARVTVPAL